MPTTDPTGSELHADERGDLLHDDVAGWHLVRHDAGGVPGRQPNIRSTMNELLDADRVAGPPQSMPVAVSFLGLHLRYRGLDPAARYRVDVVYGIEPGRRLVQSMTVNGVEVHPPMDVPEGRLERHSFELRNGPDAEGLLHLELHDQPPHDAVPGAVPERQALVEIALYSDRPAAALTMDAATAPDGSVVVNLGAGAYLVPVEGAAVAMSIDGRELATGTTDALGNVCLLAPDSRAAHAVGTPIEVTVRHGGETLTAEVPVDEVFTTGWPSLVPPPVAARIIDLDGTWEFDPRSAGAPAGPIEVPGQWAQQGYVVDPGTHARYRREIELTRADDSDYVLRFDAVYAHAIVELNGVRLGEHEGGFTPFEYDITEHLVDGVNVLTVDAQSDSISDEISAASGYARHPLGGITRSARIVELPAVHFRRVHVDTAELHDDGAVVRVFGAVDGLRDEQQVAVVLRDGDTVLGEGAATVAPGAFRFEIAIPVTGVERWTAEHPRMYEMQARIGDREATAVRRGFGIRIVESVGTALRVNDAPITLRGVERHEHHPLRGRSTDAEIGRLDIELMKGANVNNVFTCHYPHAEGFLDGADERGLWVIDESPTVWVRSELADEPENFAAIAMPILEMIERDWSRPSVVVWMLGDECLWGRNFWRLVQWLRAQQLPAPLMFSWDIGGQSTLDLGSRHYPSPRFAPAIEGTELPVTFDQYCHINCYNRRENLADPEVRDYWGTGFDEMWTAMKADPRVLGGQLWAWADDEFYFGESGLIGYGTWGLVDAWRRPKPEWWHVKMVYSPVKLERAELEAGATELRLRVDNQYDFTDLGELEFRWRMGGAEGVARVEGAPRTSATLVVPLPAAAAAGDRVHVAVVDAEGQTVIEASYAAPEAAPVSGPAPTTGGVVVGTQDRAITTEPNMSEFATWDVAAAGTVWRVDREAGVVRTASVGLETVVVDGPRLYVLDSHWPTTKLGPHHRRAIEPARARVLDERAVSVAADVAAFSAESVVESGVATTTYRSRIGADGVLWVDYEAEFHERADIRQVGVVFDVLPEFDELRWDRRSFWSVYPDDHIGRPSGSAVANPRPAGTRAARGAVSGMWPEQPWSRDSTAQGSTDFRATRRDIERASLVSGTGAGVEVIPVSRTDIRTWVEGDVIRLAVAAHTSGGSEPFLRDSEHSTPLARVLQPGDTVAASFGLRLIPAR